MTRPTLTRLERRDAPAVVATATGFGEPTRVRVFDSITRAQLGDFLPYGPGFLGGATVAVADVFAGGEPEVVTGAGATGGPHVRVFSPRGELLSEFFAYDTRFTGGVSVACSDLDGDDVFEILTAPGFGGGPNVRAFTGSGTRVLDMLAYDPAFTGGVNVSAGDLNGDGLDEIVTGVASGGESRVRAFRADGLLQLDFISYHPLFDGGVFVSTGDINADGKAEILTGAGPGGGPNVRAFRDDASVVADFFAYDSGFAGGVRVASADVTGDGSIAIVTAPGAGGGPHVRAFTADATELASSFPFAVDMTDGVFVAGPSVIPTGPVLPPEPPEQFVPTGAITLLGAKPGQFNAVGASVQFQLNEGNFLTSPGDTQVIVNGKAAEVSGLGGSVIVASSALVLGKNSVSLVSSDEEGRPLALDATLWTGDQTVNVKLLDADGDLYTGPATVVIRLGDDPNVTATAEAANGSVTFTNIPDRTVLLQGTGPGGLFGVVGDIGSKGTIFLQLRPIGTPSPIDNNDFSSGLDGWDVSGDSVFVSPHIEGNPPAKLEPPTGRVEGNADMIVYTDGEGEQSAQRDFRPADGAAQVRVRYRFVTSEIPGGFFGTQFNDYFRVTLRTAGGNQVTDANSMNAMGFAAFDPVSGAAAWSTLTLPILVPGETVRVEVAVANVADAALDSRVEVDFVSDADTTRARLEWNPDGGGLNLFYEVTGTGPLPADVPVEVFWANGVTTANVLSGAIFSTVAAAGSQPGEYGPFAIAGSKLVGDPVGTTHILAVTSGDIAVPLNDVVVTFGPQANPARVTPDSLNLIKDLLRRAGQPTATIMATARTPSEQARVMFQALTDPAASIEQNIATQNALYAPPGQAVIAAFAAQVVGLTRDEVLARSGSIRQVMTNVVIAQGPENVSRQSADVELLNVVAIDASSFTTNAQRFFTAAVEDPRVSRTIDDRDTSNTFHLEIPT